MTKRKTLCDQRLIDYVLGLYYYYEPCYVINHRLWGLQYQNLERILPRVFLFGSLWFAWTLCVFCYFAFFNLSSQQSVTCTDKVHTFAHIQINNLLSPMHMSFMILNCGVKPEQHKPKSTAQKGLLLKSFCNCSDLFKLLWWLKE